MDAIGQEVDVLRARLEERRRDEQQWLTTRDENTFRAKVRMIVEGRAYPACECQECLVAIVTLSSGMLCEVGRRWISRIM
jgi:hypothetical protein